MTNPASHMYTNTIWELMAEAGAAWLDVSTIAVQHPYLDILRGLCFTAGLAWVITRRRARRDVAQVAVRLWLVFCLTACWVWPWYFVPALALAPLAGRRQLAAGTGLTIGGLLFWAAWPERRIAPLDTLYGWRALLLFGPLVVMWRSLPLATSCSGPLACAAVRVTATIRWTWACGPPRGPGRRGGSRLRA